MKKLLVFFSVATLALTWWAAAPSLADLDQPDIYCELVEEPDPLLLGTWECNFTRFRDTGNPDTNYLKYTLRKFGEEKYGLHLERVWRRGRKRINEWKGWTINGSQITGNPKYGVRIFAQGGDVYFTIRGLKKPAKMERVED